MVRPLIAVVLISSTTLASGAVAQGADPKLGRNLAAACANCHGTDGASQQGMASLAGQQRTYLVRQMQDFRSGKRPATVMQQIAKGYTDEQVEAIAAYLSAQTAK